MFLETIFRIGENLFKVVKNRKNCKIDFYVYILPEK